MATKRVRTISLIGWVATTNDMLFIRKPIEVTNPASARWLTLKRGTVWVLKSDTSMVTSAAILIREFRRTSRAPAVKAPLWRVKGQRAKEDSTALRRRRFTENAARNNMTDGQIQLQRRQVQSENN